MIGKTGYNIQLNLTIGGRMHSGRSAGGAAKTHSGQFTSARTIKDKGRQARERQGHSLKRH